MTLLRSSICQELSNGLVFFVGLVAAATATTPGGLPAWWALLPVAVRWL
jgi:hypothetical protein